MGLVGEERLTSLDVNIPNKCPEFTSECHAGRFPTIWKIAALKWPQTFTFALSEHPPALKRENVKWSKEE